MKEEEIMIKITDPHQEMTTDQVIMMDIPELEEVITIIELVLLETTINNPSKSKYFKILLEIFSIYLIQIFRFLFYSFI